jgi:hypothetical protein
MLRVLETERGELDEVALDESFRLGRSVSGSSGRFPAADSGCDEAVAGKDRLYRALDKALEHPL